MPGFDGTGPVGQGRRTGGGRGNCPPVAGVYDGGAPVVYGVGRGGRPRGGGRGRAFGGGRGRGWRPCQPYPTPVQPSRTQELELLKEQSAWLQEDLNQTNARIAELTADQKKE